MLDKQFLRAFFDRIERLTNEELAEKIVQVEELQRTFSRGSEATTDARYMLKHLRRDALERQLNPQSGS